jgi:hypothetical protein
MLLLSLCATLPRLILAAAVLAPPASQSTPPPQTTPPQASPKPAGQGTDDRTIEAGESSGDAPARQLVKWNDYRGPHFTLRLGGGILYEGATYIQDDASQQQFDLTGKWKVRDAPIHAQGRVPVAESQTTYSAGFMYDGATGEFLVRETGLMLAVPRLGWLSVRRAHQRGFLTQ